jgi:anti-anti-sigma factor
MRRFAAVSELRGRIPASLGAVEEFCLDFRAWAVSVQLPNRFEVELLMREALANAAVHGCCGDSSKRVTSVLRLRPGRVIIAVYYDGPGFDWRAVWARCPDDDGCSGRGIAIIGQYSDRLRFNFSGNSLIMIKRFKGDQSMTVPTITQEQETTKVRLAGDLVAASVPEIRSVLRTTLDNGTRDLVLDLSNTEMVDSSGLGLIIGTYNSLRKAGGRLAVINASRDLLQLFQTMRMHQRFAISGN